MKIRSSKLKKICHIHFNKRYKRTSKYCLFFIAFQIRQEKPPSRSSLPVDTQVTIVGATLPKELLKDTLQAMLPVRTGTVYLI